MAIPDWFTSTFLPLHRARLWGRLFREMALSDVRLLRILRENPEVCP